MPAFTVCMNKSFSFSAFALPCQTLLKKQCLASEKATTKRSCDYRSPASEWRFARKRIGPWSSALLSGLANCLFMWFIITACLSCTAAQGSGELLPPFTTVSCCLLSARKVRRHLCRAKLQVTLHVLPHYSNGAYMCSLFVHVAGGFFPCSARTNLRAG